MADWNKMNDEDSSSEDSQDEYMQQAHLQKAQTSISSKKYSENEPKSAASLQTSNYRKSRNLIEENLQKIQQSDSQNIWLFVFYNQEESYEEVDKVLNKLPEIKRIHKGRVGWNLLLSRDDAKMYVRDGMKPERGWSKFSFSNKNQEQNNSGPGFHSKNSYGGSSAYNSKKTKFVEKSEKTLKYKAKISEDAPVENGKKESVPEPDNSSQAISEEPTQKEEEQKLEERSKKKQMSHFIDRKPENHEEVKKKVKYVAKASLPEPEILSEKKTSAEIIQNHDIPKNTCTKEESKKQSNKVEKVEEAKENHTLQQQLTEEPKKSEELISKNESDDEEEKLEKMRASIQKKKSKQKGKDKKKPTTDSNNPFSALEIS